MSRFVLIDNYSGYVFADSADFSGGDWGETPIEYAQAFEKSQGELGRSYEECDKHQLASNEAGYHVYRADINGSDAVPVVEDGQDQATIDNVVSQCRYVTSIRVFLA